MLAAGTPASQCRAQIMEIWVVLITAGLTLATWALYRLAAALKDSR
jgi:hypothetical protein